MICHHRLLRPSHLSRSLDQLIMSILQSKSYITDFVGPSLKLHKLLTLLIGNTLIIPIRNLPDPYEINARINRTANIRQPINIPRNAKPQQLIAQIIREDIAVFLHNVVGVARVAVSELVDHPGDLSVAELGLAKENGLAEVRVVDFWWGVVNTGGVLIVSAEGIFGVVYL